MENNTNKGFIMEIERMSRAKTVSAEYDLGLRSYMLSIYNYMAAALALTGVIAFGAASSPALMQTIFGTPLQWVVALAPLGIVMFLSFRVQKLSMQAAQTWFWVFAAAMGLSLSSIFMVYTGVSIARVFFITAGVFGSMSLYGYTTKKDLTGIGSFLMMGMFGLIIASLVNMFMHSSGLQFAISAIGVLIFTGLTAYDTQKIKHMYYSVGGTGEMAGKAAIMGALTLYLDFINLMLMLLRFFGDRR
jgi:FtsH-binding integral membrane protein